MFKKVYITNTLIIMEENGKRRKRNSSTLHYSNISQLNILQKIVLKTRINLGHHLHTLV